MTEEELSKQLAYCKRLSKLTGDLHEFQIQQLKRWPLVIIPNVIKSEFTWYNDIDKSSERYVKKSVEGTPVFDDSLKGKVIFFKFTLDSEEKAPNYNERIKYFKESVKGLLGDDWNVVIGYEKK